jgi:probable F420-dependent oxidoreductase
MGKLRFGLVKWNEKPVVDLARRAEDAGYHALLFGDHTGMLAPLPAMAAAAAVTDRIQVGPQVINVAFRPLAALAQEVAAIDVLSGGRLLLGLGAGYAEQEVRSMGLPFPGNADRIREVTRALEVLPRLFAGETVTEPPGPGRLDGFSLKPLPPQGADVPMLIGGNGDRMLAVAARYAHIVQFTGFTAPSSGDFSWFTTEALADRIEYVRRMAGDRFADLELSLLNQRAYVTSDPRATAAQFVGEHLPVDVALASPYMLFGTVDAICDRIIELRERFGISYLTVFDGRSEGFDQVVARLA